MKDIILLKPRRAGSLYSSCIFEFMNFLFDNNILEVKNKHIHKFLHQKPHYKNQKETLKLFIK